MPAHGSIATTISLVTMIGAPLVAGVCQVARAQDGLQRAREDELPSGLDLLRAADEQLRNTQGLAFTIRRDGSGAQATREPYTKARVVISRRNEATRAGLLDADLAPQWQVATFGIISSADGKDDPIPFAFSMDQEHARYLDAFQGALVESEPEHAQNLIDDSGAWTAMHWLSEWETLVGKPIIDDTPREHPRFDGNVLLGENPTNAIYVDLAEFPNTHAFGAWWYLGVEDNLPRGFELVYYDVRGDDNESMGDGISRLTISNVEALDNPTDIAAAVKHAAKILDETNWRENDETPLSDLIDLANPFTLPTPEGFEAVAYEPPVDQRQAQTPAELPLNIPAPDFTLLDPDGNEHTLSDYQGKTVIIDFWATWCGPCLQVMPELQAIHQKHKDKGVVVMGVNAWENGDPKALMDARGWDYLLLLNGDQVAADYQVGSIPTMVIVDPNGMIIKRKVGAGPGLTEELEDAIEAAVILQ